MPCSRCFRNGLVWELWPFSWLIKLLRAPSPCFPRSGYLEKTLLASKRVCLIKPVCGSVSLLLTYCLHHILLWSKHNFPIGGSLRLIRTHWGQQFSLPLLRCKFWPIIDTAELFSPKRKQWKWVSFVHRLCAFVLYRISVKVISFFFFFFLLLFHAWPRRRCCEFGVP